MAKDLITVFGASGFVGRAIVQALCKEGYRVRAAVRRPHQVLRLRVLGDPGQVELVQANLLKPELALASPEDMDIPRCVNTADEAIALLREHHARWQAK